MKVYFDVEDLRKVVQEAINAKEYRSLYEDDASTDQPELWLVGDQGVYIMSNAVVDNRALAYAQGMNPDVDDFDTWWENKRAVFGGDDFAERIRAVELINEQIDRMQEFWLVVSEKHFDLQFTTRN